jgi:hypothetical protein
MMAAADPDWKDPEKKKLRERKFEWLDKITNVIWGAYLTRINAVPNMPYSHTGKDTGWQFSRKLGRDWSDKLNEEFLPVPRLPDDIDGDDVGPSSGNSISSEQWVLQFSTTVRDALNAGWVCRLELINEMGDLVLPPDDPRVAKIESAVIALCQNIIKYRRRGPRRRERGSERSRAQNPSRTGA